MQNDKFPQFYNLSLERYSCRAYSERAVDEGTLMAVLDAARLAPSACNRQPWLFLIAEGEDERAAILESYNRDWIASAPAFIIALGDHSAAWHRPHDGKDHTDVDVAIAVEHLCMAAAAMELGTCWVCNFDPAVIRSRFNIPEHLEPVAIIPIGYPAEAGVVPEKKRKALAEIVRKGKFGKEEA